VHPNVVYLGGSFNYGEIHGRSNGRAVLLSTDGGLTFSDLTQDGDPTHAEGMHPDQHALVTVPGDPLQFIAGSDGGIIRSDGQFADISAKCDARGLDAADTAFCKSLLSRVPNQLIDLNGGLDTLQVPEPVRERATSEEPAPGRNAGQRHVPVQRVEPDLAANHLRRRWPVRLQRRR